MDLLLPGVGETVGGTIREERYSVLKDKLERSVEGCNISTPTEISFCHSEGKLEQYQWYVPRLHAFVQL